MAIQQNQQEVLFNTFENNFMAARQKGQIAAPAMTQQRYFALRQAGYTPDQIQSGAYPIVPVQPQNVRQVEVVVDDGYNWKEMIVGGLVGAGIGLAVNYAVNLMQE